MATLLEHPPVRQRDSVAQIPRTPVPPHPASTLTPRQERFSLHDAAAAILLACGEYGALAHGALWYALLHGLFHRDLA